jgi:hypothetical protein
MNLPAAQGLSVLYVLADEWMWRRGVLKLLGAEDPAPLDTVLQRTVAGSDRVARVAEMTEAVGGEMVGG